MIKNDKLQCLVINVLAYSYKKRIFFFKNHNQPTKNPPAASEEENSSVKCQFSCYLAPSDFQDKSRLWAEPSLRGFGRLSHLKAEGRIIHRKKVSITQILQARHRTRAGVCPQATPSGWGRRGLLRGKTMPSTPYQLCERTPCEHCIYIYYPGSASQ